MLYSIYKVITYNKIGVNSRKYAKLHNWLIISKLVGVYCTL